MTALQQAIVDFRLGRIDRDAIERALGFRLDDPPAVFRFLTAAVEVRDGAQVECALMLAVDVLKLAVDRRVDLDVVPTLVELLRARWHTRHEDTARWLQQLRDPRAVDALFETAFSKFPYLEYDNSYALARKCTWALADIGTPEARAKLEELARGADAEIAGYAQRRLDHWDSELKRKGPTYYVPKVS